MTDGLWVWRLPGLFINMYNWGMSVEQLEPLGPRKRRLNYRYFFTDPAKARDDIPDWSIGVAREDVAICERVQNNLEAGVYDRGRLSLVFENGVIQFQQLVEAAYGAPTPDDASGSAWARILNSTQFSAVHLRFRIGRRK